MSVIQLNFINNSNDVNNSEIVIFQKNVATSFDELAIAWRVIKNCGVGDHHPFTYSQDFAVASSDSYGNYTPQLSASPGQAFQMVMSPSGHTLKYKGPATSANEVSLYNDLQSGSISALVYRDGKLCSQNTNLAPGQKAVFQFKPTIYIGVASQVSEGQVLNSAIISDINTEINLLGIASADIVMRGGGAGPSSTPFTFTLENVVNA